MSEEMANRRGFLSRLLGTAAGMTLVANGRADAQPPAPVASGADAWIREVKGTHRCLFDFPQHKNGAPLLHILNYLNTYNEAYKSAPGTVGAVGTFYSIGTQSSIALGFNDAMWSKYKLGESQKVNDGGTPATKNPHASVANDLAKRGVIVAVCGMATMRIARAVAGDAGMSAADVEADLRANLVTPTARVVAAGVIVTNRAQERGFSYTYVG